MTQQPPPQESTFELLIETMAYGGSGMGRHAKRVVFVPYTIPGERLSARIVEERGRVAFGEGVTLIEASADRVYPTCAHFGLRRCGGCHWQHIDYPAQLLIKQDVLTDQLERIGGFTDPHVKDIIAAPQVWGYNTRQTFALIDSKQIALPSAQYGLTAISLCEVLHPDLNALFEQLDLEGGGFSRVGLARGDDGACMVTLYADEEDTPSLTLDLTASVNLILPDQTPLNLAGDTHLIYTVKGRPFRVTAGSAFRANSAALGGLIDAVLAALGDAKAVLDLYSGVGVFGAFIAQRADYVTLVESYPPAATDADENTADIEHVDVIEGSVEDVLDAAEDEYDAAVVNPPNEGMSAEALDAISALSQLKTLVYVSGDAATLARDASRLHKHGYTLQYVQPLDLAPHTYYVETVAKFTRA